MRFIILSILFLLSAGVALGAGSESGALRISSDNAVTDLLNRTVVATSNVKFSYDNAEGKCDKLVYNQNTQILEVTGHVEIKRGKDIITAGAAMVDMNTHTVTVTNNAQILVEIKN